MTGVGSVPNGVVPPLKGIFVLASGIEVRLTIVEAVGKS